MKSGVSKTSESSIGVSSISAGTTSSVAGPFLTHAKAPRSEAPPTIRHSTPPRTQSDGLNSFKQEFASMAGIAASVERSYSPVFRPRGLQHDDPLEVHAERVAEIALEMDMALDFMGDVGKFLEAKEDIEILGNCEEMAEQMIHNHIDIMDKLNQDFLNENIEADRQLEELMEMQKALGYEVQQAPQLSIEGQKIVEKEKKKRGVKSKEEEEETKKEREREREK